jgi:Cof subfamily protein (haloacid dehalogenase superfamily)
MNVVAIDMDGTLLHSKKYISEQNARALNRLRAEGHKLVIATGRGIEDVEHLLEDAGVKADGIVSLNGAIVNQGRSVVYENVMEKETALRVVQSLEDFGVYFHAYTNKGMFYMPKGWQYFMEDAHELVKEEDDYEDRMAAFKRKEEYNTGRFHMHQLRSLEDIEAEDVHVYKFLMLSPLEDKLAAVRSAWKIRQDVSITSSGRDNLEFMHPNTEKGAGLHHLRIQAGWEDAVTFAIGDNFNDVSMFRYADTAIAMENSEQDVKLLADEETSHNDDHGVAQAVYDYVLSSTKRKAEPH